MASSTLALLVAFAAYALPGAQPAAKKALTVEDYTKWRNISSQEISGDGKWVAYTLQLTNTVAAEAKPVLHLKNLETNEEIKVEHATGSIFSPDSKWIAYQVDPGAAQRARQGRSGQGGSGGNQTPDTNPAPPTAPGPGPAPAQPPAQTPQAPSTGSGQGRGNAAIPPRRAELRNLTTGAVQSWQDIQTFTFSPTSTHVIFKRRPAEVAGAGAGRGGTGGPGGGSAPGGGGGRGGAAETPAGPRGTDVSLVDLRTGRHQLLGSVGDIAFNRTGTLLAYTVDAAVKDGNGLFVFDTRSGRTATLDNDSKQYNRLVWNDGGTALAAVKGSDVEKMREKDNVLIAFPDVPGAFDDEGDEVVKPVILDPAKTDNFPKGWVVSDRGAVSWSEDNARVFFGIKEQSAAADTTRKTTDEAPDVDVWNTVDERIQSAQMVRADQDRNFTFRQAFDLSYLKDAPAPKWMTDGVPFLKKDERTEAGGK